MGTGIDTGALLQQILSSNKSNLSDLASKAMTPIPGGHATQIPATMLHMQDQPGPQPMIPHQPGVDVVGKGNARGIGIGNAVLGVTHALAATETALDNKKKLEVASATQQLITAQNAYDQAKQAYQANPANADAKAAMDRNLQVMNGILSNDKLRKAVAKGMNIDFTDPSANDSLEHAGVAQGKEMAQQHLSYGEQFNQKTPTTMQPNTQAQAQYAAAIEQQKINNEAVKSIIPLISAQLRAASADKRTEGILDASKIREAGQIAIQQAKDQSAWNRTLANIQGRKDLAKDQFGYKMQEIGAEGQKDLEVFKSKLEMKTADPMAQLKAFNDFQTKSTSTMAKLNETVAKLEGDKQTALLNAKSGSEKEALSKSFDEQINMAKSAQSQYQNLVKSNTELYKLYAGGQEDGTGESGKSTLSSADTWLNDKLPDDDIESDSDDE